MSKRFSSQQEIDEFLQTPRLATLIYPGPRPSPTGVPVWFDWDGSTVRMFAGRTSPKVRQLSRNPNVSVLVTDAFMDAVACDTEWSLMWEGKVVRTIPAKGLWDTIMRQTYEAAEPGVLFIDRINSANPLNYVETIAATNSCAEQPLPPNGTCPLASINLAKLVQDPFTDEARLDLTALRRLTTVAVRMLDNTIDVSSFAVEAQRQEALTKRLKIEEGDLILFGCDKWQTVCDVLGRLRLECCEMQLLLKDNIPVRLTGWHSVSIWLKRLVQDSNWHWYLLTL